MTKEEMLKRMDEIETRRFYLAMKDRWDRSDYETDDKWFREWLDLKKKVEEMA